MPFKTLDDKNATSEDLAKAYAEIETIKTDLEAEKQKAYSAMVKDQQHAMGGSTGAAAKLKKSKEVFQDLELKIDACNSAHYEIRVKIAGLLPGELHNRIDTLEKAADLKLAEKGTLEKRFLTLCAEAAVLQEQIKGREYITTSRETLEAAPSLNFNSGQQLHEDHLFFLEKAGEFRKSMNTDNGRSLDGELYDIGSELHDIGKILEKADYGTEAQKLIDQHLPKKPVEKVKAEPEPRKTSVFVERYDRLESAAEGR